MLILHKGNREERRDGMLAQRRTLTPAACQWLSFQVWHGLSCSSSTREADKREKEKRETDKGRWVPAQVDVQYHVRVLVPTYKETLDIVAKTVHAAYNDGKDGSKRRWCDTIMQLNDDSNILAVMQFHPSSCFAVPCGSLGRLLRAL